MSLNVVDLTLLLTNYYMCKKFDGFLGLRFRIVDFPLTFETFMCIVSLFLAFLVTSIDLKIWMKNVSTHDPSNIPYLFYHLNATYFSF